MSESTSDEATLCGYCVDLPEKGPGEAAEVSRCPLCKAELGVSRSGQRFRIGVGGGPRGRRWSLLIAPALAGAAACTVALTWLLWPASAPVEVVVVPPPPVPYVAPVPMPETTPMPRLVPPRDLAASKPYAEEAEAARPAVKQPRERAAVVLAANASKPETEIPALARKRTAQIHPAYNLAQLTEEAALRGEKQLDAAPELALVKAKIRASDAPKPDQTEILSAKGRIAELTKDVQKKNEKKPDGFIHALKEDRPDLAGLPFVLGKACQLPASEAEVLSQTSLAVRSALARSIAKSAPGGPYGPGDIHSPHSFWGQLPVMQVESKNKDLLVTLLPALVQILGPESADYRVSLVGLCRGLKGGEVTQALTRLAIYDPDKRVRDDALHALTQRDAKDSTKILLEALRHPWAPVPQRAADAITFLQREDLVPALIDQLDLPDPADPFVTEIDGKKVTAVREMVKINHHRNCLLCHAPQPATPSGGRGRAAVPVGPVPSEAEPLPPQRTVVYYEERSGSILVRADVTYLRQDFSMMLPVENADPWPKMQRFDFLVNTRVLTEQEVQEKQQAKPNPNSAHRQAILSALRQLTGENAGLTAAAWRQTVDRTTIWRSPGRIDCRK